MLIVGDVQTGILRGHPEAGDDVRRLVDLVAGEQVMVSERPLPLVRSPETRSGVDCPLLAPGSGRHLRGVGTVIQRSSITGGQVLQGSAYATVSRAASGGRQPWSHYLARPGVVETLSRTRWDELADSLAAAGPPGAELDLEAIAGRAMDSVQWAVGAAEQHPLRASRTGLRWVARVEPGRPFEVRFAVRKDHRRLLRITVPETSAAVLAAAGEDVALHDWLLTTLIEAVRKAAIGRLPRRDAVARLVPAIDHLLHLWLPGAHGDELSGEVWAVLEQRPGFSRQWQALVARIRDQLSVGAVESLSAAAGQ